MNRNTTLMRSVADGLVVLAVTGAALTPRVWIAKMPAFIVNWPT